MNDDFRAVPTSVGGLLGGAGGYALARMTDMGGAGEALMSAAGAALGGGLGYLRGKAMRDREISAAELLEAREILRKKNDRDRAIATTATAGVGAGITALGAPALARRHHREMIEALTSPQKKWNAEVRALANKKFNEYYERIAAEQIRNGVIPGIIYPHNTRVHARRLSPFLAAARAELGASKPAAVQLPRLLRTAKRRGVIYGGLGLAATAGLAGLANWLTKDKSLH